MSLPPDRTRPAPDLDREFGRISFLPSAGPAHAADLCAFLVAAGVRATAPDGGRPVVVLAGVPDLDAVEVLVRTWHGAGGPAAPAGGAAGRVQVVHAGTGRVAIFAGLGRFTVVELFADRGVEAGDELAWDDPAGLGAAVYRNRTRGTRLKVYVLAHGLTEDQAFGRVVGD